MGNRYSSTRIEVEPGLWLTKREIQEKCNSLLGRVLINYIHTQEAQSLETVREIYRLLAGDYYVTLPPHGAKRNAVRRIIRFYHLVLTLAPHVRAVRPGTDLLRGHIILKDIPGGQTGDYLKCHYKRGTTLMALARRAFLEEEGKDSRQFARDMVAFRQWEAQLPPEVRRRRTVRLTNGENLQLPLYWVANETWATDNPTFHLRE